MNPAPLTIKAIAATFFFLSSFALSGAAEPEPVKSPGGGYIPVITLEAAEKRAVVSQAVTAEQLNEIRTEGGRKTYLLPPAAVPGA